MLNDIYPNKKKKRINKWTKKRVRPINTKNKLIVARREGVVGNGQNRWSAAEDADF